MHKPDEQVVKRSIHKQYFPSESGQFSLKDLQARHSGIKQLERRYMARVKSANSPSKSVEGVKPVKYRLDGRVSPRRP